MYDSLAGLELSLAGLALSLAGAVLSVLLGLLGREPSLFSGLVPFTSPLDGRPLLVLPMAPCPLGDLGER